MDHCGCYEVKGRLYYTGKGRQMIESVIALHLWLFGVNCVVIDGGKWLASAVAQN
jgi:hypothetical protein